MIGKAYDVEVSAQYAVTSRLSLSFFDSDAFLLMTTMIETEGCLLLVYADL